MTDQADSKRKITWALIAWTILGGVLRSIGLNQQLWYDEIVTVMNTIRIPFAELFTSYVWDNQHTFYSELAQLSVGAFGEQAWTVQVAGDDRGDIIDSRPVLIGAQRIFSRESICAAALLAVSYHHIWFSQNARGYSLLMLATLIATWCFLEGQRQASNWHWMLYAVVVALGAYTHLTMVFVAVSHMLIVIGQWLAASYRGSPRKPLWRPTIAIVASGLLTILLYAPMMGDIWAFYTTEHLRVKSEWSTVQWAVQEALRGLQLGYGLIVLLGLAVISLVGCWRFAKTSPVVLALIILPGLLGLAVMMATGRNIWPRFFLYVFGNALLIVVHGVWGCAEAASALIQDPQRRTQWLARFGYGLCGIAILQSVRMLPPLYQIPKQDMLAAIQFVEQQRQSTDQVATVGLASDVFQRFYLVNWLPIEQENELDRLTQSGARVWAVTMFPIQLKSLYPQLAARLDEDFTPVKTFPATVGGGQVRVLVHDPK